MKTKIITVGIIALFAFTLSSFRNVGDDQDYHSMADKNLKWHPTAATQTAVSCAKCHNCPKFGLFTRDSSAVRFITHLAPFNTTDSISKNISPVIPDANDTESPNNFKSN